MWKFVATAKQVLWEFVELGFLAVLAMILIHLLLGAGAGGYVDVGRRQCDEIRRRHQLRHARHRDHTGDRLSGAAAGELVA